MSDPKTHCKAHPDQPIDSVCMKDCDLCCPQCRSDEKSLHKICKSVIPLTEVEPAKIRDGFLSEAVNELKQQQHNIEISEKLIETLCERQDNLDRNIEAIREKIHTTFSSLREAIDLKEQTLLTQLEEIAAGSKYEEFEGKVTGLKSSNAMSMLIESAGSMPDDVIGLVTKVNEIRKAVRDSRVTICEASKAALSSKSVEISLGDTEKIIEMIRESGKLTVKESFLLKDFKSSKAGENRLDLSWNYDNDNVLTSPLTYYVDCRERTDIPNGFEMKYSGTETMCAVPDLEIGPIYDFRLQVKFGDLLSGPLGIASGNLNKKFMAKNGLIYCKGDIGNSCMCEKMCMVCGGDGDGCQCDSCLEVQLDYMSKAHAKCPQGHTLLIDDLCSTKNRISRFKDLTCSVCGKAVEVTQNNWIFNVLSCSTCSYFVCTACVPRICPTKNNECLKDVTLPEIEPVKPILKKYTNCGTIHCRGVQDNCTCGHCYGLCWDGRCSCNDCVNDLRGVFANAHLRCPKGHELKTVKAIERKSKIFKTTCDICNNTIHMNDGYGDRLILSCTSCNYDICPQCIKKRIPRSAVPMHIFIEPEEVIDFGYRGGASAPK